MNRSIAWRSVDVKMPLVEVLGVEITPGERGSLACRLKLHGSIRRAQIVVRGRSERYVCDTDQHRPVQILTRETDTGFFHQ